MKKYFNKFWSWLDNLMKPAPVIKKEADLGKRSNGINL